MAAALHELVLYKMADRRPCGLFQSGSGEDAPCCRVSEYPIQDDYALHLCQCRKKKRGNSYKKKAEKYRGKEWGNTWVMRMNPDGHDKGISFVYDTCPLNDFARRHGYLDFLPNLCYIDQITCSAAHGKLIRHKTLADGDGECNYWILGDKDPAALADVGSK